MKRLTIIRHGKSSWDHLELADHDRPLAKRGLKASPRVGNYLSSRGIRFDQVLSSSALRAADTARIISQIVGYDPESITFTRELYRLGGDGRAILDMVGELGAGDSVAIFGHNETLHNLVYLLSNGKIIRFPTCAVASFTCDIDGWSELHPDNIHFDFFVKPKMLKKVDQARDKTPG